MNYPKLDPRTAGPEEILSRARALEGQPIGRFVALERANRVCDATNKGGMGALYESYFGIKTNSDQAPDFSGAAIELKSVPVLMDPRPRRIKERTMLTMISYEKLAGEQWRTASIRKKLDRILFVFYGYEYGVELRGLKTLKVHLWSPSADVLPFLEDDWSVVHDKVARGLAHTISEADGRILGAATKSADSTRRRGQPRSAIPAKPRAWALKPAFTWTVFLEATGHSEGVSIVQKLGLQRRPLTLESRVLEKLAPFFGRPLGDIERTVGFGHGRAKNAIATLLRGVLGLPAHGAIREFDRFGIEAKTTPLRPDAMPYESMSFPAFKHMLLQEEDWEDSDLLSRLQRILFLPVVARRRGAPADERWLGRPFFWTPGPVDLAGIRGEWLNIRQLIRDKKALELPHESESTYIHIRPKGRNSKDRDPVPGGGTVTKKCFWLNKRFIQRIVLESGADWSGVE
jgi:DNA mismatch repair endonuclease MutH